MQRQKLITQHICTIKNQLNQLNAFNCKKKCQRSTFTAFFSLIFIFLLSHETQAGCSVTKGMFGTTYKHSSNIKYMKVSRNYSKIFTVDGGGYLKYWEFTNGAINYKQQFYYSGQIFAYSCDQIFIWNNGQKIIVAGNLGYVRVYQFNSSNLYSTTPLFNISFGVQVCSVWSNNIGDKIYINGISLGLRRINITGNTYTIQIPNYSSSSLTSLNGSWSQLSDDETKLIMSKSDQCGWAVFKFNGSHYVHQTACPFQYTSLLRFPKISYDLKYISVGYSGVQFSNYLIQQNYTIVNLTVSPTISGFNASHSYLDDNQIYTVLNNNNTFYRYQYKFNGTIASYTYIDQYAGSGVYYTMFGSNNSEFYLLADGTGEMDLYNCTCDVLTLPNCKTCVKKVCTECFPSAILTNGECYPCVVGYYNNSGLCTLCHSSCNACSSASVCSGCSTGYTLFTNKCCVTGTSTCTSNAVSASCNDNYFFSSSTCTFCGNNCKTCATQTTCSVCVTGYQKSNANQCDTCSTGYYNSSGVCTLCNSACTVCSTASLCSGCSTGYTLYIDKCCVPGTSICSSNGVSGSCIDTYFLNSNNLCQICPTNCKHCTDSQTCTQCSINYYLQNMNLNRIISGICTLCPSRCSICQSASSCSQCQAGYKSTNSLVCNDCTDGFYLNNGICSTCNPECALCSSQGNNCSKCRQSGGKKYYLFGTQCAQNCPTNYTKDQSKLICACPVYSLQGDCLSSCQNDTFIDSVTKKITCKNCSYAKKNCGQTQIVYIKTKLIKNGQRMHHNVFLSKGLTSNINQQNFKSQLKLYIGAQNLGSRLLYEVNNASKQSQQFIINNTSYRRLLQSTQPTFTVISQLSIFDVTLSQSKLNAYIQSQNGLLKVNNANQAVIMAKFQNDNLYASTGAKYSIYSDKFQLTSPIFQESFFQTYYKKDMKASIFGIVNCCIVFLFLIIIIMVRYRKIFNQFLSLALIIECIGLMRLKSYPLDFFIYKTLTGFSQFEFMFVPNFIRGYFKSEDHIPKALSSFLFTYGETINIFSMAGGYLIIGVTLLGFAGIIKLFSYLLKLKPNQNDDKLPISSLLFHLVINIGMPKIILSTIFIVFTYFENKESSQSTFTIDFWISIGFCSLFVLIYLFYLVFQLKKNFKYQLYKIQNTFRAINIFLIVLFPTPSIIGIIAFNGVQLIFYCIDFFCFGSKKYRKYLYLLEIILTFGIFNTTIFFSQKLTNQDFLPMLLGSMTFFCILIKCYYFRIQYKRNSQMNKVVNSDIKQHKEQQSIQEKANYRPQNSKKYKDNQPQYKKQKIYQKRNKQTIQYAPQDSFVVIQSISDFSNQFENNGEYRLDEQNTRQFSKNYSRNSSFNQRKNNKIDNSGYYKQSSIIPPQSRDDLKERRKNKIRRQKNPQIMNLQKRQNQDDSDLSQSLENIHY